MICIENGKVTEWSDYRLNEIKWFTNLTLLKRKSRQFISVNNKKSLNSISCGVTRVKVVPWFSSLFLSFFIR
jgi:hypothetical protein